MVQLVLLVAVAVAVMSCLAVQPTEMEFLVVLVVAVLITLVLEVRQLLVKDSRVAPEVILLARGAAEVAQAL